MLKKKRFRFTRSKIIIGPNIIISHAYYQTTSYFEVLNQWQKDHSFLVVIYFVTQKQASAQSQFEDFRVRVYTCQTMVFHDLTHHGFRMVQFRMEIFMPTTTLLHALTVTVSRYVKEMQQIYFILVLHQSMTSIIKQFIFSCQ